MYLYKLTSCTRSAISLRLNYREMRVRSGLVTMSALLLLLVATFLSVSAVSDQEQSDAQFFRIRTKRMTNGELVTGLYAVAKRGVL